MVTHLPGLAERFARERGSAADKVDRWFAELIEAGTIRYERDPPPHPCDLICPPSELLRKGSGDCLDFSIYVLSAFLDAGDNRACLYLGFACDAVDNTKKCERHAWVEGTDAKGHFLFESTLNKGATTRVVRGKRPHFYRQETRCDGASKTCEQVGK